MKQLLPYRILTFILLPVAALIGLITLLGLFVALANPTVLLPLFILACVVIYIISSFIFLQKGIDQNRVCKASLKDWIRVNAIVSVVFCAMFMFQTVGILSRPDLLNDTLQQAMKAQQNIPAGSEIMVMKAVKGMLYFMMIFSLLLLLHILLTFRALNFYKDLFEEKV